MLHTARCINSMLSLLQPALLLPPPPPPPPLPPFILRFENRMAIDDFTISWYCHTVIHTFNPLAKCFDEMWIFSNFSIKNVQNQIINNRFFSSPSSSWSLDSYSWNIYSEDWKSKPLFSYILYFAWKMNNTDKI